MATIDYDADAILAALNKAAASVNVGSASVVGSYSMAQTSGTIAAGMSAAAPVWSAQYTGSGLMVVRKVTLCAQDITTGFAAGQAIFNLFAARAFTGADSVGTAATITTNNGKLRTSFPTTGVGQLLIATTGKITAGTRTLDAQPLNTLSVSVPVTANFQLFSQGTVLFQADPHGQPIVLANNEGLVLQGTVPATGTWNMQVQIEWDEVTAF